MPPTSTERLRMFSHAMESASAPEYVVFVPVRVRVWGQGQGWGCICDDRTHIIVYVYRYACAPESKSVCVYEPLR